MIDAPKVAVRIQTLLCGLMNESSSGSKILILR